MNAHTPPPGSARPNLKVVQHDIRPHVEKLKARGLTVFPIRPPNEPDPNKQKVPAEDGWQQGQHVPDGCNVGCFLRDGFILDFDTKDERGGAATYNRVAGRLEDLDGITTYTQRTPSGGFR